MTTEKGKKRLRSIPVLHESLKKKRTVWLTDEAWHSIQKLATTQGVSGSECLEQMIRKQQAQ